MKKQLLLFILALLCVPLARGQSSFQNPLQGPITSTSAACAVAGDQSCVWQKLSANAAVATVQVSGTFSATLTVEANNGGANFTTLGTITTAGTTSYVVSAFTDFRVRASAYTSGTAVVTINSSSAPSGGVTSGTADPTGNACSANALFVQTTTGNLYSCDAGVFAKVGPSAGSSVSITATSPVVVTPSPLTGTGVASCPTCVVATTPGVGLAHFAGSTQAVTSSAVNLASADVTGQLPIGAVGSAGLSGTSPIAIASTGAISCPTCNTSAAPITNNVIPKGSGGAQGLANSLATDDATSFTYTGTGGVKATAGPLTSGANGGAAGVMSLNGSTSGTQTCTTNATAGSTTCTGTWLAASISATGSYVINGRVFGSGTTPSIAAGGCGGAAASIVTIAGTLAFDINVGTTPTSGGCTVTMPAMTTGYNCSVNDFTTISSTVFVQKQTTKATNSIVLKNFDTTATAQAPVASDIYHVTCIAD